MKRLTYIFNKVNLYFLQTGGGSDPREPKTIFTSIGLLKEGKPTVAAILLFGNNPQRFFPRIYINAQRLEEQKVRDEDGNETVENVPVERLIIKGSLDDLILKGLEFVTEKAPKFLKLKDVIKEAVINAVVHRDYTMPGPIELNVWNDRVEISNPGGLTGGMTMENLLSNPQSIARNPRIVRIMSELGFGDNLCRGIDTIRRGMREKEGTEAIFRVDPFSFTVVLPLKRDLQITEVDEYSQGELGNAE